MEEPTQPSAGKIFAELTKRKRAESRVWRSVIFSILITIIVIAIAESILLDSQAAAKAGLVALIASFIGSLAAQAPH